LFVVAAAAALHRPQHHLEGGPLFVQQGELIPGADFLIDVLQQLLGGADRRVQHVIGHLRGRSGGEAGA
jgi:hypothetical protein